MTTTMKVTTPQCCPPCSLVPIRDGGACANRPRRPPSPCQSPPFDAGTHLNDAPMIRAQVNDPPKSRYPHSKSPPADLKSP